MVQKNRPFLVLVGLMMLGSPALGLLGRVFWVPAAGLFLTGAYLLVWATFGRGAWCRVCKKFSWF